MDKITNHHLLELHSIRPQNCVMPLSPPNLEYREFAVAKVAGVRYQSEYKHRQSHGFDNEWPHECYPSNIQHYFEMGRWVHPQLLCPEIVVDGPALLILSHFIDPFALAPPLAQWALLGHPPE